MSNKSNKDTKNVGLKPKLQTQYLDDKTVPKVNKNPLSGYKIECYDERDVNKVGNIVIDYGGVDINPC